MKNLQNIFESITPDNIKDIPVIRDAMQIFIETLQELSKESIDIRNAFENEIIKEELVKIYLDDLYRVFKTLQFNQTVVEKIERLNSAYGIEYYKVDVILNIAKYINEEHFLTFKSYKEKKGTVDAIRYIYELVGTKLLSEDNKTPFTLIEYEPFVFDVSGNLPSELYEAVVRPLAHPLGFVYQYNQLISLLLEDIFLSTISYEINTLEVRCLLPNGSTQATNYKYEIDGTTLRVVTDIITTQNSTTTTKKIVFQDGNYLEQVTTSLGQTHVYYKDINGDVLIAYDVYQCSIYFDYNFILTTGVQETTYFKQDASNTDIIATDEILDSNELNQIFNNITKGPNANPSLNQIEYINASTVLVGSKRTIFVNDSFVVTNEPLLVGQLDELGNPYRVYGAYSDINDDNTYRYYLSTYNDADAVNLTTATDDIFGCGVFRSGVELLDNNYAAWLAVQP